MSLAQSSTWTEEALRSSSRRISLDRAQARWRAAPDGWPARDRLRSDARGGCCAGCLRRGLGRRIAASSTLSAPRARSGAHRSHDARHGRRRFDRAATRSLFVAAADRALRRRRRAPPRRCCKRAPRASAPSLRSRRLSSPRSDSSEAATFRRNCWKCSSAADRAASSRRALQRRPRRARCPPWG